MSNFKFELNIKGVDALRKSPEMHAVIQKYADNVVANAGDGFEQHLFVGKKRLAITVTPGSVAASKKNLKENTLVKALGAAK